MQQLRAHVHNGRLVLDEPTDLPEGVVVELVPLTPDSPRVAALRKRVRGETLTNEERELSEGPAVPRVRGIPHEHVMLELEERRRREQSAPRQK